MKVQFDNVIRSKVDDRVTTLSIEDRRKHYLYANFYIRHLCSCMHIIKCCVNLFLSSRGRVKNSSACYDLALVVVVVVVVVVHELSLSRLRLTSAV